jgi:hypothetical protein
VRRCRPTPRRAGVGTAASGPPLAAVVERDKLHKTSSRAIGPALLRDRTTARPSLAQVGRDEGAPGIDGMAVGDLAP